MAGHAVGIVCRWQDHLIFPALGPCYAITNTKIIGNWMGPFYWGIKDHSNWSVLLWLGWFLSKSVE